MTTKTGDRHAAKNTTLLGIVIGNAVSPFVVNVASSSWANHRWIWGTLGVLTVLLALIIPEDGLLSRAGHGGDRWVRLLALVFMAVYPLALWSVSKTGHNYPAAIIPSLCLWLASALLLWTSHSYALWEAGMAIAVLAIAHVSLALGYGFSRLGFVPVGLSLLLVGAVSLLVFVGFLSRNPAWFGWAGSLLSAGVVLQGVVYLKRGLVLDGMVFLLVGVSIALFVVALLRRLPILGSIGFLTAGVGGLVWAVSVLLEGSFLWGLGFVLFAIAWLLLGFAIWRDSMFLYRWSRAASPLGVLTLGVALARDRSLLMGVALLVAGAAALLESAPVLWTSASTRDKVRRLMRWLTANSRRDLEKARRDTVQLGREEDPPSSA